MSVAEQQTDSARSSSGEASPSPFSCSEAGEDTGSQSAGPETTADEQHPTTSAEPSPSNGSGADALVQESGVREETSESADDSTSSQGSDASCSESADSCARSNPDKGSQHPAASAAQATVEKFEPHAFGTLEEHVQSHDYPAHVATCGACKFWRHRWSWSQTFSYCHPISGKKETWLAYKNGFGVCLICSSHPSVASSGSKFAVGRGNLLRKDDITAHSKCASHIAAREAMMQRLKGQDSQEAPATVAVFDEQTSAASAKTASNKPTAHSIATRTTQSTTGRRAVVAVRVLLETTSSFHSMDAWLAALTLGDRDALESSWHAKRLVGAMAQYERIQTYRLLQEGAVFRLAADGQQRTYQVEIGTVLWSFPHPCSKYADMASKRGGCSSWDRVDPGSLSASLECGNSHRRWAPMLKSP